jgi:DNA-binding SARP family transcriptional activator
MLEIKLFGQFDIQIDSHKVKLTSRPAELLFIYLVLHSGVMIRRDKLASLLWPDSDEKQGRSNLRHALWRLRKAFDDAGSSNQAPYFVTTDETIQFDPLQDSCFDVAFF